VMPALTFGAAPLQCVELKPDWAKGYSRLGAAHFGLEEWDQAIQAYEDGGWRQAGLHPSCDIHVSSMAV
jgi:predicted TPR repeat methyltransferase